MMPDDAGARQRERQVLDQQPVAVALAQALDLDDRVAQPRPGRDGDLQLALRRTSRVVGLVEQLLVGAEAGLALGLAGLGAHAHPFELARERALPGVDLLLLARMPLQLLLEPARVVAGERDAPAPVELQDPLRDVVEEVAVVGDGDDRARVLLEEPLQPLDGLGVEVVGRLVEQQQVGVLEQQPAQRDASLLAAGQRRDVGVVGRAAQRVHRDLDVALQVPGVGGVDLVLQRGLLGADRLVVGVGLGPLGHHRVVLLDQAVDLAHAVHDVALDVLGRVELRAPGSGSRRVNPGVSRASPVKPSSSPAMIRSRLDLPAPFGPMTPILAPG